MVVEQFIWPPRKKASLPLLSNRGVMYNKFQNGSPVFLRFRINSTLSSRLVNASLIRRNASWSVCSLCTKRQFLGMISLRL